MSVLGLYQFSAAIAAALHLEPTKELQCCFDKLLCLYCSLSDLLLYKKHWSDSNSTKLSISSLRWDACVSVVLIQTDLSFVHVCVLWILNVCVLAAGFSHCLSFSFPSSWDDEKSANRLLKFLAADLFIDFSTFNWFFGIVWNLFSFSWCTQWEIKHRRTTN